jgi:hypothetical protein
MTKQQVPPVPEAAQSPTDEASAVLQAVIWVHDGPVCVAVVDLPRPHVASGVCRCEACGGAHRPDRAVSFF